MSRWFCRFHQTQLVDAAEGRLPATKRQRLEIHLERCPACREELTALRDFATRLARLPFPDPGDAFWMRQRQQIAEVVRGLPPPVPPRPAPCRLALPSLPLRFVLTAAAAALVMVAAYQLARRPLAPQWQPDQPALAFLDTKTLETLLDYAQALGPVDGDLGIGIAETESSLASLLAADLVDSTAEARVPEPRDLDDDELENIAGLVGDTA